MKFSMTTPLSGSLALAKGADRAPGDCLDRGDELGGGRDLEEHA
jgi:hypothetical protein